MAKKLFINPPKLFRWLPADQQYGVLLDLEPDFLDSNVFRIDLDIVFRPAALRRGLIQKQDYYVGSTGAQIRFKTSGEIKKYTSTKPTEVTYQRNYKRAQKTEVKIGPKVETKEGASFEAGDVTFGKDVEREYTTSFSGVEKQLQDVKSRNMVEWDFVGGTNKAFRDYVMGNLSLYVESSETGKIKGEIIVRPSDVAFFDGDRRRIENKLKALGMKFRVWLDGISVSDEPTEVHFEET